VHSESDRNKTVVLPRRELSQHVGSVGGLPCDFHLPPKTPGYTKFVKISRPDSIVKLGLNFAVGSKTTNKLLLTAEDKLTLPTSFSGKVGCPPPESITNDVLCKIIHSPR
jgi:hypothetical protein